MTSQQIDLEKITELINSGELHYEIIRDVAVIEMLLDAVVAYYFTTHNRWIPFADLILDRFTVTNKVSIVDKIPYKRRMPSLSHMKTLRDIVQARNFLAHTHYILPGSLNTGRMQWLYLFADYPRGYERYVRASRQMLHNLCRTREMVENNPHLRRRKRGAPDAMRASKRQAA